MRKTRVEHDLGKPAIATIQSGGDGEVAAKILDAAVYMATAGFLDQANRLVLSYPNLGNGAYQIRALAVLWDAAGAPPTGAPLLPQTIDEIEVIHRRYMAPSLQPQATSPTLSALPDRPPRSWQGLSGLHLYNHCLRLAAPVDVQARIVSQPGDERALPRPDAVRDHTTPRAAWLAVATDGTVTVPSLPSPEDELAALAGLEAFLDDAEAAGGFPFASASCLASELAARHRELDRARALAIRWADRYPDFWTNYIFWCMAANRHVVPLLLEGMLAGSLGLTAAACQRYADGLLAALDERLRTGRTLAYGSWSWRRLLRAISTLAIKDDPDAFTAEQRRSRWLGHPPATVVAIATAEERLGLPLPSDYVAFLRTSNGFPAWTYTAPRLLPVDEIAPLRDVLDADTIASYKGFGPPIAEALDTAILISAVPAEQMAWLIPPSGMEPSWQTWFVAYWVPGEDTHPSFRAYMEDALHYFFVVT